MDSQFFALLSIRLHLLSLSIPLNGFRLKGLEKKAERDNNAFNSIEWIRDRADKALRRLESLSIPLNGFHAQQM